MNEVLNRRVFPAGTDLFRQGAQANHALIIQSGIVEILRTDKNVTEVIETCERGELIDIAAIMADNRTRTTTARAVTPVVAVTVSRGQVADRISRADPLIRTLITLMADKIERGENRRHERCHASERAFYVTEDGISIDCQIVDLSLGGVCLKPALPVRRGDRATLTLRDIDRICAVVVHVGKGVTRLRFDLDETRKRRFGEVMESLPRRDVPQLPSAMSEGTEAYAHAC